MGGAGLAHPSHKTPFVLSLSKDCYSVWRLCMTPEGEGQCFDKLSTNGSFSELRPCILR